ncbi:DUF2911 domain-containing protein [Mucilaginibacter sp. RS28]|uniref:DUF2911 domain-containing protein n=1 Tax=Mucilaginibacter straminoryzae TaxID=2932774 RepID=A0A9X1X749_9SPHI|nr:DUF2911 domain-containing protein [Mucilaginibacter straminoryzae]MCJ8211390.1 DUF2911 domain-containing protein [Mucilaginibacter straminoryzae]
MKIKQLSKVFFLALAGMLMFMTSNAQMQRKSPHQTATGSVAGANVTIVYGSPAVKGREIWGGLVPYDKAWRAGADEATIFETDKDITIQGAKLPAGKYSLFIIPTATEWTVIFNSQTGQWGIKRDGNANYEEAKNVISVKAKVKKTSDLVENLTYKVDKKGVTISWEHQSAMLAIK